MKKILLLGGSRYLLPVIEAAHRLGLYVITCDFLPDNIAHKFSDEYVNVSIIDKEATLREAQRLHIDGVLSFACDPGVVTAAYVAEQMGLPSVGPYESVCILQNKSKFRDFLKKNGFCVPTAKGYSDIEQALKEIDRYHWPVIVKPVDSAGSKGVTRVDTPCNLEKGIHRALQFSHCKEFIIEDYIEQKGYSSDTDSFSVAGELKFISFNNQYFDAQAENQFVPAAYSWPSSMSEDSQQRLREEVQRLISLLGMGTAIYNIETREDERGNAYIMELSPRGGGNRLAECVRYATGIDMITATVKAAVGMPIEEMVHKPYNGNWGEIILHSDTPGIFKDVWISDEVEKNIVERDLWIEKGQTIGGFSAANEAIGTLIFRFEDEERMKKVLENQSRYIRILLDN